MTGVISLLSLFIFVLVLVEIFAVVAFFYSKNYKENDDAYIVVESETSKAADEQDYGKFHGVLSRSDVYKFLDFDDISDGMVIRYNGSQFVMAIQCFGVNYDLSSKQDQVNIEQGFQQFLNVLKFPVQLYVQTRMVNFRDILEGYHLKANTLEKELKEIEEKLQDAKSKGDEEAYTRLIYDRTRKQNLYEYARDAISTTEFLSSNKRVLERKNYIIISYSKGDLGTGVSNYSQEEIKSKVYRELMIRANNIIDSLSASGVTAKILDSEELIELYFVAYNRDDTEYMQIADYLNSEYDDFYATSKDIFLKQKEVIEEEIEKESRRIVASSLREAEKTRKIELLQEKAKMAQKIREKSLLKLKTYKDKVIDDKTYDYAKKVIDNTNIYQENGEIKVEYGKRTNKNNNNEDESNNNTEKPENSDNGKNDFPDSIDDFKSINRKIKLKK